MIGDLNNLELCREVVDYQFDEVYQLAADISGAGYIFTGNNDAAIMRNSSLCNLNILEACRQVQVDRIYFSSSACIYPEYNQ